MEARRFCFLYNFCQNGQKHFYVRLFFFFLFLQNPDFDRFFITKSVLIIAVLQKRQYIMDKFRNRRYVVMEISNKFKKTALRKV